MVLKKVLSLLLGASPHPFSPFDSTVCHIPLCFLYNGFHTITDWHDPHSLCMHMGM